MFSLAIKKNGTSATKQANHFDGNIPFVTPSDLDGRKTISESKRCLSKAGLAKIQSSIIPQKSVMVSCIGSDMGKVALSGLMCCTNQQINSIIVDKKRFDPDFIYYNLLTRKEELRGLAGGSAQPILNKTHFSSIDIYIPSLHEQYAISEILGKIDDKIELNRQINATLEGMAQAIFQSWFVDFDPVHAKTKGHKPASMSDKVVALFPDSFEDSELGKIPSTWQVTTIGETLKTVLGGTPSRSRKEYWENGTIPWINSGKANEFRIIEPSEYITKAGYDNSATKLNPKRTTVIAITGATLGQISMVEIETCTNQSLVGILGNNAIPDEFVYFWVKEHLNDLINRQTGGAQQHINKENVNDLTILFPPRKVINHYVSVVSSFFDRISQNCFLNKSLSRIRNILLPKLLSGEISIKSAEKQASEAI